MDERQLIAYLGDRFKKPPLLDNWLDDDCEIINVGGQKILISVDTSSEGVDFPSSTPPEAMGYFSTALSLSDIAACGGRPLGVLVSCSIPPNFADKTRELYDGIEKALTDAGTFLLGGDTNSAGELSLSVVSIGTPGESILRRKTANVGDLIGVTGILDRFNYGYSQYASGTPIDFERAFLQPPKIAAGSILSGISGVTSCIDLPDGLIKALDDNMPPALGVLLVDSDIPIGRKFRPDMPNYLLASHPAGDIELMFTASPGSVDKISLSFTDMGLPLYWIGRVVDEPSIRVDMSNGRQIPAVTAGFVHKFDGYKLFR